MFALAFILVILFLIVAVVLGFAALFGGMLGPQFNRFNPFLARAASPDPVCGQCGYATRGISSFECPECGADLREVGIKTPEMHSLRGAGCVLPIVWTVGIFFGGAILGNILLNMLPREQIGQYHVHLTPNASTYQFVALEADYRGPGTIQSRFGGIYSSGGSGTRLDLGRLPSAMQVQKIRLRLHAVGGPNPGSREFEVDYANRSFRYQGGNGQWVMRSGSPRSQDVLDWFKANQLLVGFPAVAQEADERSQLLDALAARLPSYTLSHFKASQHGAYAHLEPISPLWHILYILVCFIVWTLGLYLLNRRPKQTANKI